MPQTKNEKRQKVLTKLVAERDSLQRDYDRAAKNLELGVVADHYRRHAEESNRRLRNRIADLNAEIKRFETIMREGNSKERKSSEKNHIAVQQVRQVIDISYAERSVSLMR